MNRCLPLPVRAPAPPGLRRWVPRGGQVAAGLSLLALASLSYVAGAAAMHFSLPSSDFLGKAFTGAEVWFAGLGPPGSAAGDLDRGPLAVDRAEVTVDRPGETYDGFTL